MSLTAPRMGPKDVQAVTEVFIANGQGAGMHA